MLSLRKTSFLCSVGLLSGTLSPLTGRLIIDPESEVRADVTGKVAPPYGIVISIAFSRSLNAVFTLISSLGVLADGCTSSLDDMPRNTASKEIRSDEKHKNN